MSFGEWEAAYAKPSKPYPWKPIENYSPDANPSSGAIHAKPRGKDIMLAAEVKGLGVIVFRATSSPLDKKGKLVVSGMSLFTEDELRNC